MKSSITPLTTLSLGALILAGLAGAANADARFDGVTLNVASQHDQIAFPFAGYANVLAYRKDLYAAAGLKPPATMEELVADAIKLTDPAKKVYGFVANGQKGPAVAQDWMQYNRQFGGSILDANGKP